MTIQFDFDFPCNELELHRAGCFLGMLDVIAVVTITDEGDGDWFWEISDWRARDAHGGTKSIVMMARNDFVMDGLLKVLKAQEGTLRAAIDNDVEWRVCRIDRPHEHRLLASELL